MASPRFEPHESTPRALCTIGANGLFWKLTIKRLTSVKFYLVDGPDLVASSNNPVVVPNSDSVFKGKTGSEKKRVVEVLGLSVGVSLIEFKANGSADTVVVMQVEVLALPGKKPSFVSFSAKAVALNGPHLAQIYRLDDNQTFNSGPPEALFASVPGGTKHVVLNCHAQMVGAGQPNEGITLFIAGNVNRQNCTAVFSILRQKSEGGVIWIGGCEAGADNQFCKAAVMASGCFLVAPAITLPIVPVPHGKIDFFSESMIKFFNKDNGEPMRQADFMVKHNELNFGIVPG